MSDKRRHKYNYRHPDWSAVDLRRSIDPKIEEEIMFSSDPHTLGPGPGERQMRGCRSTTVTVDLSALRCPARVTRRGKVEAIYKRTGVWVQ